MCGGIRFPYSPKLESGLQEYYTPEQCEQARSTSIVESVFWQARPILPAMINGEIKLFDWGNRDPSIKLPKTGWIRAESLTDGKWNYLHPQAVIIPAIQGVEKKIWFAIDEGIQGFLVWRGDMARIYMLTLEPDPEYKALTGHDRMPALINQERVVAL